MANEVLASSQINLDRIDSVEDPTILTRIFDDKVIETLTGSKVYYSQEMPSGGNYNEGDIWYAPDDSDPNEENPRNSVIFVYEQVSDGVFDWVEKDYSSTDDGLIRANIITGREIVTESVTASNIDVATFEVIGDKNDKHLRLEDDGVYLKDGDDILGKFSSVQGGKLHIRWSEYYNNGPGVLVGSYAYEKIYMIFPLPAFDESFTISNGYFVLRKYRSDELEERSFNADNAPLRHRLSDGYFIIESDLYAETFDVVDFYFDYNVSSGYSQLELGGYPSSHLPKLLKVGNGIDELSGSDAMSLDWNGVMEVSGGYNGPTANLESAFVNGTMDYEDFTGRITPFDLNAFPPQQPPDGITVTITSAKSAFHNVHLTFSVTLKNSTLGWTGTNAGGQIVVGDLSFGLSHSQAYDPNDNWQMPLPVSQVTGMSRTGAYPILLSLNPSGRWGLYNMGSTKLTSTAGTTFNISVTYISSAKQHDIPVISGGGSGGGASEATIRDIINSYGFMTSYEADEKYSAKGEVVKSNTTAGWLAEENTFVPDYETIIVYVDYLTEGDINGNTTVRPGFKIGDGVHTLAELPFTSAASVKKLAHSLNIGSYHFDGSEDVDIPVYTGEIEFE